jgi:SAM-dependent methyltransferase
MVMKTPKADDSIPGHPAHLKNGFSRGQCFDKVARCPLCRMPSLKGRQAFMVTQVYWDICVLDCPGCGLLYKSEVPSNQLMGIIYGSTYVHFSDCSSYMQSTEGLSGRTRRLGVPHGRYLDYGCGAGSAVWYAQRAGWDSYGCDPFLPSLPAGHPLIGRLFKMDANSPELMPTLGKFDRISLWAVVEHLTDVYQTFENLASLLKPHGKLIFNCPNGASLIARKSGAIWDMANLVEHIVFMTPRSARWLATRLDMELEYIRYAGVPYPCGKIVPSFGAQGLPPGQFEMPVQAESIECAVKSKVYRKIPPLMTKQCIGSVLDWTKKSNFGGILGIVTRKAMHISRLGDHIEVGLRKKST